MGGVADEGECFGREFLGFGINPACLELKRGYDALEWQHFLSSDEKTTFGSVRFD